MRHGETLSNPTEGGNVILGIKTETVSKFAVVVAMALGIGMIALDGVFVAMGMDAKGDIHDALVKEQVIPSKDAPIPGVLVQDAKTAKAQQDTIEGHTFGRWGPSPRWTGKTPTGKPTSPA